MTNQPTEQQVSEFWKWCGFTRSTHPLATYYENRPRESVEVSCWVTPTGETIPCGLPDIDLNNLFKYAVPKAIVKICQIFKVDIQSAYKTLFSWWLDKMFNETNDTIEALFWALWQIKGE